jgi:hypothetical protein
MNQPLLDQLQLENRALRKRQLLLQAREAHIAELERWIDCGQDGPCVKAPGCNRHWEERNRELVSEVRELEAKLAELKAGGTPGVSPEVCNGRGLGAERVSPSPATQLDCKQVLLELRQLVQSIDHRLYYVEMGLGPIRCAKCRDIVQATELPPPGQEESETATKEKTDENTNHAQD